MKEREAVADDVHHRSMDLAGRSDLLAVFREPGDGFDLRRELLQTVVGTDVADAVAITQVARRGCFIHGHTAYRIGGISIDPYDDGDARRPDDQVFARQTRSVRVT